MKKNQLNSEERSPISAMVVGLTCTRAFVSAIIRSASASSSDSAAGAGFGACGCNASLSQLFPGHSLPVFFTISRQFFALFYRLARKPEKKRKKGCKNGERRASNRGSQRAYRGRSPHCLRVLRSGRATLLGGRAERHCRTITTGVVIVPTGREGGGGGGRP